MCDADNLDYQLGRTDGVASVKLDVTNVVMRLAIQFKENHDEDVERIAESGDTGKMHAEVMYYAGLCHALEMLGILLPWDRIYQDVFATMRPERWAEVTRAIEAEGNGA